MEVLQHDEALKLASPYPYVLATVLDKNGKPNAIGLAWWTYTSWDPLHIAISVGKSKYSHECLEHLGEFVLHFPAEDQAKGAWICGTRSGKKGDKMAATGFELIPSLEVKPPTIAGATAAYECRIYTTAETGDHTLFIAEVVAIRGRKDKPAHLYTFFYDKLLSLDCGGKINLKVSGK